MKLTTREENGIVIFEISGKIMGGEDETVFYGTLQKMINLNKNKVIIDLAEVEWINSLGLGLLISGLTTMRNNNGDLKLTRVAEKVESLLVLTRLITAFESYDTVDDALASFS
jgi:anti-sigma B factor antagonist